MGNVTLNEHSMSIVVQRYYKNRLGRDKYPVRLEITVTLL